MNKKEVLKLIGANRWAAFQKHMKGQTVGVMADGTTEYYECDVQDFINGREPSD